MRKSKQKIDVLDDLDEALENSEKLPVDPRNNLNDLTAKEWIVETISVWNQRGLGAGFEPATFRL